MKLYSAPLSLFARKVEIALREKGLAFERVMVPFSQERGYAPKHPDVLAANPKGQVPVLVDGDLSLFDSTVILEYLEDAYPDPPLFPASPPARARCRMLELFADEVLLPDLRRLMYRSEPPAGDPERRAAREADGRVGEAALRLRWAELESRLGGGEPVRRAPLGRRHRAVHDGVVRPAAARARLRRLPVSCRVVRPDRAAAGGGTGRIRDCRRRSRFVAGTRDMAPKLGAALRRLLRRDRHRRTRHHRGAGPVDEPRRPRAAQEAPGAGSEQCPGEVDAGQHRQHHHDQLAPFHGADAVQVDQRRQEGEVEDR